MSYDKEMIERDRDIGVFSEEPIAKGGLTSLEYAAIHLRVEHPDLPTWLNEMIRKARRDEFTKATMQGMLAAGFGGNLRDIADGIRGGADVAKALRIYADELLVELKK